MEGIVEVVVPYTLREKKGISPIVDGVV